MKHTENDNLKMGITFSIDYNDVQVDNNQTTFMLPTFDTSHQMEAVYETLVSVMGRELVTPRVMEDIGDIVQRELVMDALRERIKL